MSSGAVANAFMDILFPPLCPLCASAILERNDGLCRACGERFALRLIREPLCLICGAPFRNASGGGHACGSCIKTPPSFIRARSLYAYEGEVRKAVHELKYRWGAMLGPALGRVMAHAVTRMEFTADMVVPVPLHKNKIKKRGFNQSVILARHLARALSWKLDITNLVRSRPTLSQVGLASGQRRKNVAGAFDVKDAELFRYRSVLLVDDVFTTGATVGECSRVLKKAGARVAVVTLARVVL